MEIHRVHSWQTDTSQAAELQNRLSEKVSRNGDCINPRYIAGIDISVKRGQELAKGAVVVLNYPELEVAEIKIARSSLDFPYIPGFLSFREAPLALAACEQLTITPDLFLIDGQGIAHPRRLGLASHLGLFLDRPTIGCAKSPLCGKSEEPGSEPGEFTEIIDKKEIIGATLRTKYKVKPLYISIGHKIDLQTAIDWVLKCRRGYRLPEPTRLAHQAAGGIIGYNKDRAGVRGSY